MENKQKTHQNITRILLSIFLSYMTVILSLRDYPERSVVVMAIFFMIYHLYTTERLINLGATMISKILNLKLNSLEKVQQYCLLPSSAILGMASLVLSMATVYYLEFRHKFSLTQQFWVYSELGESLPSKIYIFIFISIILFFVLQVIVLSKYEKIKLIKAVIASLVSTVIVSFGFAIVVILGIIVYYIGGSLLLGY